MDDLGDFLSKKYLKQTSIFEIVFEYLLKCYNISAVAEKTMKKFSRLQKKMQHLLSALFSAK